MNSKERVQACIRRERTDAVPLGFYLVDHDTISKVIGRPTYVRNKVAAQIAYWEGRRDEVVESMKADIVEFYRKMDLCDLITFKEAEPVPPKGWAPTDPPRKVSDTCWEDSAGRVFLISELSNEFVCIKDPVSQGREWNAEDFQEPVEDVAPDPSTLEVYNFMLANLSETRYIAGLTGGLGCMVLLGGMERGLMEYVTRPGLVRAAGRQSLARRNLLDRHYLRPDVPGAFFEEDLCSTKGPMMSPAMFREFCFPILKERIANIRGVKPDAQIIFHSCGNSRRLMEMFIEAGVQVYQSIQAIPEMWVGDLKTECGERLVFWGGVPVDELVLGTPESIRTAVRRAMEAAAPGGGFILGPSHSVAYGTKYENFMVLLDEFDRLRFKFN